NGSNKCDVMSPKELLNPFSQSLLFPEICELMNEPFNTNNTSETDGHRSSRKWENHQVSTIPSMDFYLIGNENFNTSSMVSFESESVIAPFMGKTIKQVDAKALTSSNIKVPSEIGRSDVLLSSVLYSPIRKSVLEHDMPTLLGTTKNCISGGVESSFTAVSADTGWSLNSTKIRDSAVQDLPGKCHSHEGGGSPLPVPPCEQGKALPEKLMTVKSHYRTTHYPAIDDHILNPISIADRKTIVRHKVSQTSVKHVRFNFSPPQGLQIHSYP
ncbi:MAG: hypothetical protein ACPGEF_01160, partial [Endozoicomonas sp.]